MAKYTEETISKIIWNVLSSSKFQELDTNKLLEDGFYITNDDISGITQVDIALSETSINPVQNKAVASALKEINTKLQSVYSFKGNVANLTELKALTGMKNGDVYNLLDTGDNYAYVESANEWDKFGGAVDLSGYYTKLNVDNLLSAKSDKTNTLSDISVSANTMTLTKANATTSNITLPLATTTSNGIMSAADKTKLDNINNNVKFINENGSSFDVPLETDVILNGMLIFNNGNNDGSIILKMENNQVVATINKSCSINITINHSYNNLFTFICFDGTIITATTGLGDNVHLVGTGSVSCQLTGWISQYD